MQWYGGSIAEAVTLSKQRNAIFVVFVEDGSDSSSEMAATIDNVDILKRLADEENFLAIKLKSGSENYVHFARIYQFVPVPSIFFIGRNGAPLEVVCAGVQADSLASRIDRILHEHQKEKPEAMEPSTSSQNLPKPAAQPITKGDPSGESAAACLVKTDADKPETSSGNATKYLEVTKSGKEYEVVCEGDVCVRRLKVKPGDPGPSHAPVAVAEASAAPAVTSVSPSAGSIEDKMEHAKDIIEARKKEKADKEKELEKEKEMERRTTGKGVAELKRWQADQELKHIQEERKREKMADNLARQRILEQIAQDRAERRARDVPPQPQHSTAPPPNSQTAEDMSSSRRRRRSLSPADAAKRQRAERMETSGDASSGARIQFKLPDGTSHSAHFDADDTLADLRRYVADNLQLTSTEFSIWTAFPRRELTGAASTLRELQLAPSAALLVLPARTRDVQLAPPSSYNNFVAMLSHLFASLVVAPLQSVAAWVRERVWGPAAPGPARAAPGPARAAPGPARAAPAPPPPADRADAPHMAALRRRGNIHRLPNDRAGEDDNNTWNGNSTQQM